MKNLFFVLLPLVAILVLAPITLAQSNFRNEEVATLSKNETIDKDYFATGEKVTLSGTVNGDAYLAGGNIIVDGTVNGDLLVGGGNINITGDVTGDIRVAGGSIQIDGAVGGNITTLGGNVRIDDDSDVEGSVVAGAGNMEVFGPIGKGITAGAGTLLIGNTVGGDVVAGVEELDLAANAKINGELNYMSEEKAGIAEGASVTGKINHQVTQGVDEEDKEKLFAGLNIGFAIFKFLTLLVIGSLLLWAVPNFMRNTSVAVRENPLQSLAIGFLVLVVTPIVAVVLMITLIGLPLGLVLLLGYFFLIYISVIFTAVAVGDRILDKKSNRFLAFALGLFIISVLLLVPVIGGLVDFAAMLLGLGAAMMTKKAMFQNLRSKKLI